MCRSRRPKFACLGAVTKETGRGEGGGRRRKVFLVGRKTAATLASKGENRQRLLLAFWALGRSGETSSILASSLQKAHYMAVAGRVYISCYNEVGREREGETTFIAWAAAAAAALQCEEAGERGFFSQCLFSRRPPPPPKSAINFFAQFSERKKHLRRSRFSRARKTGIKRRSRFTVPVQYTREEKGRRGHLLQSAVVGDAPKGEMLRESKGKSFPKKNVQTALRPK